MTKKAYQAPEVELIGLSTNEICIISFKGNFPDGEGGYGGVDDGTNDPDANSWDSFDNSFDNKL